MTDSRPRFSALDARRLAHDLYGIQGKVRELPAELDRNFLVEDPSGDRYVLKISPGDTPELGLSFQVAALRFLAETSLAPRTPVVVPTAGGKMLHRHHETDGQELWVRLYRFLEGRLLVELPAVSSPFYRDLGRFLARLDCELLAFDHPGKNRDILWDITRTMELFPALSYVDDSHRREIAEGALSRFRREVIPALPRLRRSVIHNDANDHNVLVSAHGAELLGLIDFGDMINIKRIWLSLFVIK